MQKSLCTTTGIIIERSKENYESFINQNRLHPQMGEKNMARHRQQRCAFGFYLGNELVKQMDEITKDPNNIFDDRSTIIRYLIRLYLPEIKHHYQNLKRRVYVMEDTGKYDVAELRRMLDFPIFATSQRIYLEKKYLRMLALKQKTFNKKEYFDSSTIINVAIKIGLYHIKRQLQKERIEVKQ